MTRHNRLLLAVLTFVVVCVVGYALFSENVKVSGTATAYGNWNINISCTNGISSEVIIPVDKQRFYLNEGYKNDFCTVIGNNISFNADLLYPGASRDFTIKVENKGDIPAVFDLSDSDEEGGFSNTTVEVCEVNSNNQKVNCGDEISYETPDGRFESRNPLNSGILGAKDTLGNFYHPWSGGGLEEHFVDENYGFVLKPGEVMYFDIGVYWNDDYDNLENKAHYSIDINTHLNFIQVYEQ